MLKTDNLDQNSQFHEEEGFRQIDLLHKTYKLDNQRELLIKKLKKLQKIIKKYPNENLSIRLKSIKKVSNDIVHKKKIILSQIKDSYNFFKLSDQIKTLQQYVLQLNKAIKRKEIDANTHRITKDYYENQLKLHFDNLNKLKMVAKEYIIILKNQELQLKAEERFINSNFPKKVFDISNIRNANRNPIQDKNELKQLIQFLTKEILDY